MRGKRDCEGRKSADKRLLQTRAEKTWKTDKEREDRGRLRGNTHVCGAIPCVVPDVIHHGGEVLQTVWDVVRKQQYTHRLQSHT